MKRYLVRVRDKPARTRGNGSEDVEQNGALEIDNSPGQGSGYRYIDWKLVEYNGANGPWNMWSSLENDGENE